MVDKYRNSSRDAITYCVGRIYRWNLLVVGVLTRITGAVFGVILLGAIFHIRWENGFFVSKGGWEWDLVMLAAVLGNNCSRSWKNFNITCSKKNS